MFEDAVRWLAVADIHLIQIAGPLWIRHTQHWQSKAANVRAARLLCTSGSIHALRGPRGAGGMHHRCGDTGVLLRCS